MNITAIENNGDSVKFIMVDDKGNMHFKDVPKGITRINTAVPNSFKAQKKGDLWTQLQYCFFSYL